ncbi:MAG: flavodoxin domain-containing protein [Defluviitaleaceae bacterium]|nr:flavodoxin domain-containing protein [Defluviitaleaceae bacterium]
MKLQKKIAVIYKSKYGSTKQYAQWISIALEVPLFEASEIKPSQLEDYDVVIYGGGLYAGGIDGVKLVTKSLNKCKQLVVFTVGLADVKTTNFSDILSKAFTQEQLSDVKIFHLRGAMDYKELSLLHKGMMAMVKKDAEKTPTEKRTSDDVFLLETYGKKVDFMDKNSIKPIVEYVCSLDHNKDV